MRDCQQVDATYITVHKIWAEIVDWKRMHRVPPLFVHQEVDLQETCICLPPKYFGQKFWIESETVEELDNGSGGTLLSLAATGRHPPHAELPHCVKTLRSIWLNKIVVQYHTYTHCTPDCYDKTIGYYTLAIIEIHSTQYIHCTHYNNILVLCKGFVDALHAALPHHLLWRLSRQITKRFPFFPPPQLFSLFPTHFPHSFLPGLSQVAFQTMPEISHPGQFYEWEVKSW